MIRLLLLLRHDLGDSGQRVARLRRTFPCGSFLIDIKAKPWPTPSPGEAASFLDWKDMVVASELRLGEPPRVAGGGLAQIDLAALAGHAAVLRTRRGQDIAIAPVDPDATLLIRSGFLTLECALPGTEPHIVALLLPGDVLRSSHLPPRCDTALRAHASGEIFRLRSTTAASLATQMPALARHLEDALARYQARQALHEIALAHVRLRAESRDVPDRARCPFGTAHTRWRPGRGAARSQGDRRLSRHQSGHAFAGDVAAQVLGLGGAGRTAARRHP